MSVVRGRVLTPAGEGLRGVRVSPLSSTSGAGFTLTRTDGWFDIMINGGGVVTLKFGKSPFIYQSKSISVPWNQVRLQSCMFTLTNDDSFPDCGDGGRSSE